METLSNNLRVQFDRDWPNKRHDPKYQHRKFAPRGFCRAVRLGSFPPVTADLRFWYFGLKSPAFQFYATDWLGSQRVQMMTLEQEGAYIRLVAYCWQHGTIPRDPKEAARLIGKGASTTLAERVLEMFIPAAQRGRLTHDRLEEQRARQEAWRQKSSEGGRKSAELRSKGGSTVVQPPSQPNGNIPYSVLRTPSPKGKEGNPPSNEKLGTSERITLEQSLKRIVKDLEGLKDADIPQFVERRRELKAEKSRLLGLLGLKA